MDFTEQLGIQRQSYFIRTNGGIALPAAGLLYWLMLAVAGYGLQPSQWMLLAFAASGLIFPLGLLLRKPLRADILAKSPLASAIGPALLSMMLSWPIIIVTSAVNPSLAPLTLAVGMGLHWPVIGWLFGSRVCMIHAISRVLLVTALWYLFPNDRFTLIPLMVAFLYGLTIAALRREVNKARHLMNSPDSAVSY